MGWLYMKSLKGYENPQHYLDNQFTYENPDVTSKVLSSALIKNSAYYAAVERRRIGTGDREIWAVICLIEYDPRAADGYVFGYKDMCESMGPYESECPEAILDLLTPTDSAYALEWRARCRVNLARHARTAAATG